MQKNKIILRYLIKENFISFLIIFIFSCLLFISIDLIELIRRGSSKNIEFGILTTIAAISHNIMNTEGGGSRGDTYSSNNNK